MQSLEFALDAESTDAIHLAIWRLSVNPAITNRQNLNKGDK